MKKFEVEVLFEDGQKIVIEVEANEEWEAEEKAMPILLKAREVE